MKKLTDKQKRFCEEYLIDFNATQAALRAGYSKKSAANWGSSLLKEPQVARYIDSRMAKKDTKLVASQDEVLEYLTSVLRGESKASEIVIEGAGAGITAAREMGKAPSEKDRLKAAELLGKAHGTFTEKVDLNADMDLNINIDYGDEGNGENS